MNGLLLASLLMTSGSWDVTVEIVARDAFQGANEVQAHVEGTLTPEQIAASTSTIDAGVIQGAIHPSQTFRGSLFFSPGAVHLETLPGAVSGRVSTLDFIFSRVEFTGDPIGLLPLDGSEAQGSLITGGIDFAGTWQFGTDLLPFSGRAAGQAISTGNLSEGLLLQAPSPILLWGWDPSLGSIDLDGINYRATLKAMMGATVHTPEPSTAVLLLLGLFLLAEQKRWAR